MKKMKNKRLIFIGAILMVLFATIITISCNKKFDEPLAIPITTGDSTLNKNTVSIKTLKALHTIGGLEKITQNYVINGIVGGSDESGNLYKTITIQDATGGITLALDRSGLYNDYPVGRQLYIKCQGLYISDRSGCIQLGVLNSTIPSNPSLTSIPSSLFDNYIVKGTLHNPITPKVVTLAQLNDIVKMKVSNIPALDTLQSTVIQLNNVELATTDTGLIYADTSAAKLSVSRNITDCIGTTGVVMYSSGYADFAGFPVPTGKGTILAVYVPYITAYKQTAEIEIRDTGDVQLTGTRCGAAVSTTLFSETFSGVTNKATITTTGSSNVWQNIAEVGGISFVGYVSGSTHLASISGYVAGGNPALVKSWMISQAITIPATTNSPKLTFVSEDGYYSGATFEVLVSTDYNGNSTPSTSTWTVLPATIPTGDAKFTKAVPSGSIDLSNYIGKSIYLAWRYTSSSSTQAGTGYEFGTVKVIGY